MGMKDKLARTPEWETIENWKPAPRTKVGGRTKSPLVQAILRGEVVRYKGTGFGAYSTTIRRNLEDGWFFHAVQEGEFVVGWIDQNGVNRGVDPGVTHAVVTRVSPEMHQDLKSVAASHGSTVSNYVKKVLEDALEYED